MNNFHEKPKILSLPGKELYVKNVRVLAMNTIFLGFALLWISESRHRRVGTESSDFFSTYSKRP
jgi:hypothetical protein